MLKKIFPIFLFVSAIQADPFLESFKKGQEYFLANNCEQAIASYTQAITLNPECHQAYFNLGLVHAHQGRHAQALEWYTKAIALCSTYLRALVQAGNVCQELKHYDQALTWYTKGLALDGNAYDCLVGLARALNAMSSFEESASYYKKALKLNPQDSSVLLECANTLNMAHHTDESLEYYYTLLERMPNNCSVLYNIAYTLKKLNKTEQALPYYHKVLALEPDNTEAHFSLALAYLASGNFEQGWHEYEWRWKRDSQGGPRSLSKPLWDGSSLDNKTLLLHAEQGLGDTLQFIRYAQRIKKQHRCTIILASQDPLIPLMRCCPYLDHVISLFGPVPAYDVQAPLLSVPYIMKTRVDSIPCTVPYLYAQEHLTEQWKSKLSSSTINIGLCWQGNSNYSTHFLRTAVAAKSIPLKLFTPLFNLTNVTFYNLQKITGEDQLNGMSNHPSFVSFDANFDQEHGRFMDTAAVIKNLDLMITVDTSIAHLAAGLGVQTWILLPEPADWRWMGALKEYEFTSPWYPNMRLFRQKTPGDWETVIEEVATALKAMII